MMSPFVCVIPYNSGHLFVLVSVLFVLFVGSGYGRASAFLSCFRAASRLFSGWSSGTCCGSLFWGAVLTSMVLLSLFPLSTVGFHFPLLGIGISGAIWVTMLFMVFQFRFFQWKKEFFSDSSLSPFWVVFSLVVETMSRLARAVTLGARISVNVMMGGILHGVVGSSSMSGGLLVLSLLEVMVVIIQSYVFILLVFLYSEELE